MNTHELIELAVLDSLGILEPHEVEAFERAFADADPRVQRQVRAEHDRLGDIEHLLPDDEPRPELRAMVLSAVRAAIDSERRPIAGRIEPARRPSHPRLKTAPRVNPAWRAASIALAATVIVLLVFGNQTKQVYKDAQQHAFLNGIYDTVGAEVVDLLTDPSTVHVSFTSTDGTGRLARAGAWHHESWKGVTRVFFAPDTIGDDSTEGDTYRVVVLDSDGNIVRELKAFTSTGQLDDVEINLNLRTAGDRLAITRVGEDMADFSTDEIILIANQS